MKRDKFYTTTPHQNLFDCNVRKQTNKQTKYFGQIQIPHIQIYLEGNQGVGDHQGSTYSNHNDGFCMTATHFDDVTFR